MATTKKTAGTGTVRSRSGVSTSRTGAGKGKTSVSPKKPVRSGKKPAARTRAPEYEVKVTLRPEIKTEIFAIILFALALLLFISLFISSGGGFLGGAVKKLLVGCAGFGAYILPLVAVLWGTALILGKSKSISLDKFLKSFFIFILVISFVHITAAAKSESYASFSDYVTGYYEGGSASNGGLIGAVFGNFLTGTLGKAGAYVLMVTAAVVLFIMVTGKSLVDFMVRLFIKIDTGLSGLGKFDDDYDDYDDDEYEEIFTDSESYTESERPVLRMPESKKRPPIKEEPPKTAATYKKPDKKKVFDYVVEGVDDEGSDPEPEIHLMADVIKKKKIHGTGLSGERYFRENPAPAHNDEKIVEFRRESLAASKFAEIDEEWERPATAKAVGSEIDEDDTDKYMEGLRSHVSPAPVSRADRAAKGGRVIPDIPPPSINVKGIGVEGYIPITVTASGDDFVAASETRRNEEQEHIKPTPGTAPLRVYKESEPKSAGEYAVCDDDGEEAAEITEEIEEKPYVMPEVDLLTENTYVPSPNSRAQILENSRKLEETLKSFGVEARVVEVSIGPTVTRYELSPGIGVKVSKISNLADDLALNLAALGIRIEAPIPGKSVVGIEIPNNEVQTVFLRDVVEDKDFWEFPSKLSFAVGKDIAGNTVIVDIAKMPHLLIAGATGAGKSVCINTIIASILFKATPDEVKMLMVDPKVVELNVYNGIPHLEIPVVTDPQKAAGALSWGVREMNSRYNMFAKTGTRDLKGYNSILAESGEKPLPQIVIIIDELADLMMSCKNDVEQNICRLAQKARAAGIHLIIATQRPSVDVITGLIKANVPSRLAFAVTSGTDSRTILDMVGAEKLLGKGDMLFSPAGLSKPQRIQGAFISDKEVERLVSFIKKENGEAVYDQSKVEEITAMNRPEDEVSEGGDEFISEAISFVTEKGKASVSMLQRQFRIGYNRAARMMEELEARGIVGPEDGAKPRKVLTGGWRHD